MNARHRSRVLSRMLCVVALFLTSTSTLLAQTIQNPFYTDPAWKLWYENQTPVGALSPPLIANWLFPDDADTVANPGLFLEYRTTDWPQRKYAGHWHDVYSNRDNNHATIRASWSGDFGNSVTLRPPESHMRLTGGNLFTNGVSWTNQSTVGLGHDQTRSFSAINNLEQNYYFANILRSGPTHISYIDHNLFYSTDEYDALVPVFYNSIGSSGSETSALTKLVVAGGYLSRSLKPELLRNGLFTSAMLYLWKAALPYSVPYEHELRHRVAYMSYGDGGKYDVTTGNRSQIASQSYHYDPTEHMGNMVALAKGMYVVPPIAILKHVATLSGTEQSVNKTVIRIHQTTGEAAQVRVSTEESYDLQGLPVTARWKVLNGNKNTTVDHEGGTTYLITVPDDPNLPRGKTVIALVINNGFYDSNIATVNVYRPDGSTNNLRVRPVTGLADAVMLPGETTSYPLHTTDPEGFPVTFSKWDGVGELDGNVFTWASDVATEEGSYPLHVMGSDGTSGNGYGGGEASIEISNTVAELTADQTMGTAPFTINFSATGSRDKDSNILTYAWNFDDGSSATIANPSYQFTQPGFYQVALTVTGPLGSHTARQVIEVRGTWPIAVNNGWDLANGVDPAIWTATGAQVVTSGRGDRLQISGGAVGTPVGLTSVQSFTLPLYLEAVYRKPSHQKGNGIQVLGSLIGHTHASESYYLEKDTSIGHPTDADPSVWESQFIGEHFRQPLRVSQLRVHVQNDPNNPGKIRYMGYLDTDLGSYFFKYDNQDPTESWFDSLVALVSEDSGVVEYWRLQVWTPTGLIAGPEINLQGSNGQDLYDEWVLVNETSKESVLVNGNTEFHYPDTFGGPVTRTFIIQNEGTSSLTLIGAAPHVTITGVNSADFSVSSAPATSISAGGSTTFDITFTPGGAGLRLATLSIASDDADEPTSKLRLRGRDRTPREINIEGNGINIVTGDVTPNSTDHTDFSFIDRGASLEREYLIQNSGVESLAVSGVSVSGTHASDFVVSQAPRSTLESFESSAFKITFTPGGLGLRSATIEVSSNDADEPLYTFTIQGNGIDTIVTDQSTVSVAENGTANLGVKLSAAPLLPVTVTVSMASGGHMDTDVTVQSGGSLNFDAGNWNTFQNVTFAAADDPTDTTDGIAIVMLDADSNDFLDAHIIITELDDDTNVKPVASSQSVIVDEDCAIDITLAGFDSNASDPLTFMVASNPTEGNLTGTAPAVTYQGNLDYNGADSFTFTVSDGLLTSDPATVSITVTAIDDSLDTDSDGLTDQLEKCTYGTDFQDTDTDNDGLNDGDEVNIHGTDPANVDTDADGMPDGYEFNNGLNPLLDDSAGDLDGDGLNNLGEYTSSSDPNNTDTDGDALTDGDEVNIHGTSPTNIDTDGDTLSDGDEVNTHSTNPLNTDTDSDGLPDDWEINHGLDPLVDDSTLDPDVDGLNNLGEFANNADPNNSDTDGDGLNDGDEVNTHGTDPTLTDTDGDKLTDSEEINIHGTDPLDAADTDEDGMPNDWETVFGLNPADDSDGLTDADLDGVINYLEFWRDTDPNDIGSVPAISTYYVDINTCTPGNMDGSPVNPYCGIQQGIDAADGGDTVLVAGGSYVESFVNLGINKPIILTGAAGQRPSYSSVFGFVDISGIAWGTVSGFSFANTFGVRFLSGRNILFENNHVRNTPFNVFPAITVSTSKITIKNNFIFNNASTYGIIVGASAADVDIINTTVTSTTLIGIDVAVGGQATITNSIVWGNISGDFGPGVNTADVQYTLSGNPSFAGINGSLTGDPLFVNAAGFDYHLQSASLAIDTGDPLDSYSNELENNGDRINLGAYGNTIEATTGNDADGDGLTDQNEQCYDGDCGNYDPYNPATNPGGTDLDYASSDTDGDGYSDSNELMYGSDPIDELSLATIVADGDVNLDGQVNVADVLLAQRYVLGLGVLSQGQIDHGDVYPVGAGDGLITLSDVLLITQQAFQ